MTLFGVLFVSTFLSAQTPVFEWVNQMGSTSSDRGKSVAIDVNGNVYTTGWFEKKVDFDPGSDTSFLTTIGSTDIYIQKLDANGNLLWVKQIGGTSYDRSYAITTDKDSNVYSTGQFRGTVDFDPGPGIHNLVGEANEEVYIQKLDANGNFIWAKRMGSRKDDKGNAIAIDASGNVITTGSFQGTVDFDPGPGVYNLTPGGTFFDVFIQKLDADGDFIWAKGMGGITSYAYSESVAVDASGNVYTDTNTTATFSLINEGGCDSVVTLNLTLDRISELNISVEGVKITANNTSATYVWLDCDDNFSRIIGEIDQSFNATVNGNYAVELTENDCVDTSGCVAISTVGINENSFLDGFVVYPNPTAGSFTIKQEKSSESLSVRLLSITGEVILNKQFQNTKVIQLELNQLNGIYVLEITDEQDNKAVLRLIAE